MRRFSLLIFLFSAFFAGVYYFNKIHGYEEYRIKPLDALASKKKYFKININLANQREFDNLPGVGPKLAAVIVRYRDEHGSFKTIEALNDVPGIGDKKFAKLVSYLLV